MAGRSEIVQSQRSHWQSLMSKHEGSPQAVGSESFWHKVLRYEIVSQFMDLSLSSFTVHDIGCGVGDFYGYLKDKASKDAIDYSASDIVPEYIEVARQRYPDKVFHIRDIANERPDERYDYVILSGVFHQHSGVSVDAWADYMKGLLLQSWRMADRALIFNFLSSQVDYKKDGNYYPSFTDVVAFVGSEMSRFFKVNSAIPLYEITMAVYTPMYVKKLYPLEDFKKYLR